MLPCLHSASYFLSNWGSSWMYHQPVLRPLLCSWNSQSLIWLSGSLYWLWRLSRWLTPLSVNGWTTLSPACEWLTLYRSIFWGSDFSGLPFHLWVHLCPCCLFAVLGDILASGEPHGCRLNCSLSLCWKAALWGLSFCLSCSLYNSLPSRQHHIPSHLAHRLQMPVKWPVNADTFHCVDMWPQESQVRNRRHLSTEFFVTCGVFFPLLTSLFTGVTWGALHNIDSWVVTDEPFLPSSWLQYWTS